MATGTGKTTVMAMIITWQVLNAVTYPKRTKDFSRAIFIVAPGITVKERLQVLYPGNPATSTTSSASARPRRCARSSTRPRSWSRTGTR